MPILSESTNKIVMHFLLAAVSFVLLINQISNSQLSVSNSVSFQKTQPWACNFITYPNVGCNAQAYCDRASDTCVCNPYSRSSNSGPNNKNHRIWNQNCLAPVDLGMRCQSSGQCRANEPNSVCNAVKHFHDWRCVCADTFVQKGVKCETDDSDYLENPYKRCASLGEVYVKALDSCVDRSHMPYYAHRKGSGALGALFQLLSAASDAENGPNLSHILILLSMISSHLIYLL